MFGSVIDTSEPAVTGRPLPDSPQTLALSTFVMNSRNSTASGGASLPTANPSPPPNASVAAPAPPSTIGNGNQPSSNASSPSGTPAAVRNAPGAHWPMRSIAARPLPMAPDSSGSHVAARKPGWKGSMSMRRFSSSPAAITSGTLKLPSAAIAFITSAPPSRTIRYE